MNVPENKIFSVAEFIRLLNIGLKTSEAKIMGEVSEFNVGPNGHVYFVLKDEKNDGVINAIIWRNRYHAYGVKLEVGMKIIAFGHPEIYAPRGRLSFMAETIEHAGEGKLKKEYDKLKKKLEKEGIFDKDKKKPIPRYPQKVGIITSRQGAVKADFINNIGKFGFNIKMVDSRVEGQIAVNDLLDAIKTFKKEEIDVLVIIRGGGSLESMMPFNNELLVREIANFSTPVLVGIGHDKDEPLATLAADVVVSTPTAAANCLNESWEKALLFLERYEKDIMSDYERILNNAYNSVNFAIKTINKHYDSVFDRYKKIESDLMVSLQNFKEGLSNIKIDLDNSINKSFLGFKTLFSRIDKQLEYAEKSVNSNNPERQLMLGYSIARCEGKIIRRVEDVREGKNIDLKLIDGIIISEVKNINKINKK